MSVTVEINNISKTIGKKEIIKNISLNVNAGEVLGLLGPNGAGKTTIIRMIVGLIDITGGSIKVCDHDTEKEHHKAMEHLGAIVENPEMYPFFTGQQNLEYFARMEPNVSKEKIAELVEFVGLTSRITDKVSTYSLGMKQRLGIAQSLLSDPKVLILDEPTNGLDPAGMKELRRHIRMLAEEKGVTVIVSSHLLSEIELMCDRVAVIRKGELIAVEDILEKESFEYHFKISDNTKAQKLVEEHFQLPSHVEGAYFTVQLPNSDLNVSEIVKLFVEQGISIYSVELKKNSLEDRFINLTTK